MILNFVLEPFYFGGGRRGVVCLEDDGVKGIKVKGLCEIVIGAKAHSFDGIFHGRLGGHDDDHHFWALFAKFAE